MARGCCLPSWCDRDVPQIWGLCALRGDRLGEGLGTKDAPLVGLSSHPVFLVRFHTPGKPGPGAPFGICYTYTHNAPGPHLSRHPPRLSLSQ